MTAAYSLRLKRVVLLDVVTLAGLYVLRVLAGGMAVSIPLSPWFLAFFMFIFLALAVVKRQSELHALRRSGGFVAGGRAWRTDDLPVLAAIGSAAGFASVVVLALYVQSPEVSERVCPAGGPVAGLSVAGLLAGAPDAARQPRGGGRRSGGVRATGPHELADRPRRARRVGRRAVTGCVLSACKLWA